MLRPITVTVTSGASAGSGPAFSCTETFASASDAEHWRRMVEETLARPEALWLDLPVYAAGLAETIRTHGGDVTREKWLSGEASPQDWALGRPVVAAQAADKTSKLPRLKRACE
jgi:hypothetical protein